jgi:malate permease and related proteins
VILVALAIVASTAIGVAAERRDGPAARTAARRSITVILWLVLPVVTFFTVARLELDAGVGAGLGLAYLVLGACGLLAFALGTWVLRLRRDQTGALIVVTIMANTGYLGVPLCAALLGTGALAPAIAWDTTVSGPMFFGAAFAIGAAMGTAAGDTARARLRAFLWRNPPLLAVLAALVAPDALAPDVMVDVAEVLVFAVLPVGFFILGVNLAGEAQQGALPFPPPLTRAVATAIGVRLLVAPALMLGAVAATVDVPDAYLVQAAMPAGINSLIVAHAYGLDLALTSAAVAWTTAIVVVAALGVAAL